MKINPKNVLLAMLLIFLLTSTAYAQNDVPKITDYSPLSPAGNIAEDERAFNISINQTVNVTWLINGSFAQFNESVMDAEYINKSAAIGTWNVTAIVENKNGTDMQKWDWIVSSPPAGAPEITGYSPSQSASNVAGDERTFNISVNQTVNVTWLINGSLAQFNESVMDAEYINKSAAIGTWNVTAIVENKNGTDMQKWDWIVSSPPTGAPEITGYSPSLSVNNAAGDERTFNISVNQTVNVTWLINGTIVQFNESVNSAKYTNKSASVGTWNVTAMVKNDYGNDVQRWDWTVSSPQAGAPEITGHSPSSSVSDITGAKRTFSININLTANVSWYINGTRVQFNESATTAKYTNTSAAPGSWNVTAVAENADGTDMQKWDWTVSSPQAGAPKIISSYPADILIYNNTGEPRTFRIIVDNIAKISWYVYDLDMKGSRVQIDTDVSESSYTNTGMPEGVWIVEAVAENEKGSDSTVWVWIVTPHVSEGAIKADVEIKPETLNLRSNGKMTVTIELPGEYNVEDIDFDNLTLEGAHPVGSVEVNEHNTVKVKFNRQDLENISPGKHVALTVTGRVLHDGNWVTFEGRDTIRVIDNSDVVEEDDDDKLKENEDDELEDDNDDDEEDLDEASETEGLKENKVKNEINAENKGKNGKKVETAQKSGKLVKNDAKKDKQEDDAGKKVRKGNANGKAKSTKKGEIGKKNGKKSKIQDDDGDEDSEEDDD